MVTKDLVFYKEIAFMKRFVCLSLGLIMMFSQILTVSATTINEVMQQNSGENTIDAQQNAEAYYLDEDEELREQIKGAGIGASATRAEIMKKLERIKYIEINTKTQIITPSQKGEAIFDIVNNSL